MGKAVTAGLRCGPLLAIVGPRSAAASE